MESMLTDGAETVFTQDMTQREHKPEPKRVQSHCRVDCTCGWRGPVVPMFGQGHEPWVEHFKAVA